MPLPHPNLVPAVSASLTNDLLYALLQQLIASGGGTPGTAVEVSGATANIGGDALTTYSDKRFIAFEWLDAGTGTVIIDSISYTPDDMLPVFIDLGTTGYHRDINVDASGCTNLLINYLDKA